MREAGIGDLPLGAAAQISWNGLSLEEFSAGGCELIMKNDWQESLRLIDVILEDFHYHKPCGLARYVKISSTGEFVQLVKRLNLVLLAGRYALEGGIAARP
jgi:hypothetical protein